MKFGIIGSGSWATALAKILTDNNCKINWLVRNEKIVDHIIRRHHNPNYLSSVYFDTKLLSLSTDVNQVVSESDCLVVAVPSAYNTKLHNTNYTNYDELHEFLVANARGL